MAIELATAYVNIVPSARGFSGKLGRELSGPLNSAGSAAGDSASTAFRGKFSKGLKVAGVAAASVFASGLTGALAVIGVGAKEASDASAGIAQLNAGIKSTGNVAKVSVPHLEGLASSIQGFSGQTDDSIVASEQLLLTFTKIRNGVGKGNDIFDQATLATANLAAKMGGDASTSAIQLGKALNDPVKGITALQRVGVSFTQGQRDQIKALVATGDTMGAQKIILKELNTEFGGAAKAAGQSIPGQLARAKRAFEDLSQGIVQTLIPIVLPAVQLITKGLKALAPIAQSTVQSLASGLSGFGAKVGAAFKSIDFSGLVAGIQGAVKTILPPLKVFGAQLVDLFVNHLVPLFATFARVVGPVLIDIGGKLAKIFAKAIVPAFKELADFANTKLIPVVKRIADVFSVFLGFLAQHEGAVKVFAKVTLGLLVARFAALKVKAAVQGVRSFVDSIKGGIATVKSFATKTAEIAKSVGRAGSAVLDFGKNMLVSAANVARQTAAFVAQKVAMAAAAVVQKAMTAAQWLLNAAMDANPVVLIVAGIAALVAGVVLAYQHFKPFRDIVDAVGRAFRTMAKVVVTVVVGAFNWIRDHWPLLLVILTGPFGAAVLLIKANWDRITGFISGAFNWIRDHWPLLLAILTGPFGLAVIVIKSHWDQITGIVLTAIAAVQKIIKTVTDTIAVIWDTVWSGIRDAFQHIWNSITHIVGVAIDFVMRIIQPAIDAIKWVLDNVGKLGSGSGSRIPGGALPDPVGVPGFASGAVITRPTLAFLGETSASRPEIVTPEALLRSILAEGPRNATAPTIIFQGTVYGDDHLWTLAKRAAIEGMREETDKQGFVRGVRVAG